mgnify:CR=1 FL=1
MLILSLVFDRFFVRFWILIGFLWAPLGAIFPPLKWDADPENVIFLCSCRFSLPCWRQVAAPTLWPPLGVPTGGLWWSLGGL